MKLNSSYSTNKIFILFFSVSFALIISGKLWAQTQEEDTIFFDSNTNSISEESREILIKRAESLKDVSDYSITLEGYSDITGRADYNLELSRKRAQLVKDYLVDLGIDSSSIDVVGKGGTEKYGAGETNESLEQNRRVNFIVDIPYVPAIEIEPEESEERAQDVSGPTQEPDVTQEQVIDENAEEVFEVIATPIPLKPISDEMLQNIQRKIRQNASDGIIFISPGEMQAGQSYKVEAQVSSVFIGALSKDLPELNMEDQVGLNLSGSSFDINTQQKDASQLKTIVSDAPSLWEWNVTPNSDGIQTLILSVIISGKTSANKAIKAEFTTFQRVVDVKSNIIHSITSSYLIMGVLILFIVTMVAWVLIRTFRIN